MVTLLLLPLVAVLGALGRRVAGGGFQDWTKIDVGDFPARGFFGLMLTASVALGGWHSWWCLSIAVTTLLGCSVPVGGIGLNPWKKDAWTVLLHGLASMSITGLPLLFVHFPGTTPWFVLYIVAGPSIVGAYTLGWKIARPSWPRGLNNGVAVSECLWGAMCGIGALLAGAVL